MNNEDRRKNIIVGLVALYKPKAEEMKNIEQYVEKLDYCFLLDDSGFDNKKICECLLEKYPGKVEYYLNSCNMGLCRSVNNGFKMAQGKNADWALVMNPDGTFQNDAIGVFRKYLDRFTAKKTAIIAPRFNIDRRKKEPGTGYKRIKYPDMTGCLYNIRILERLGYFDPNTYFYGLDLEYCLRVRKNGYKIIECSEAVLNHNPAKTYELKIFNKAVFKYGKDVPQRYYYQFRSSYYIGKKYNSFYNFAFSIYKFMKVLFLFDHKAEYLKMIKMGIDDARRGFFGNINDR